MLRLARAGNMLAATLFCMLLAPMTPRAEVLIRLDRGAGNRVSPALLADLGHWIDRETDLPLQADPPIVRFVSLLEAHRLSGPPDRGHGRTRGLYDAENRTIYLVEPWSADEAQDVATLLHELVHHRQRGLSYLCAGRREEVAYRAQDQWLAEQGLRADVNWLAIIWHAGCRPRDMHPD